MTTETTPRPEPKGGVPTMDELLARLNSEKKGARMMGPDKSGEANFDYPAFFERKGIRTFNVDTGLGVVGCRVPRMTLENKGADLEDIPDDVLVPFIVKALTSIPSDWKAEETMEFGDSKVKVTEGDALPSPTRFHDASLASQRDYLVCLPKSLGTQVFIALGYMSLPPLPTRPPTPRS